MEFDVAIELNKQICGRRIVCIVILHWILNANYFPFIYIIRQSINNLHNNMVELSISALT